MPRGVACILLLVVSLLHAVAQAADGTGPLRINPFVQPEVVADEAGPAVSSNEDSMLLRGVMLAGEQSLANIGGKIVGIGQEINGYRLIAVNESNVVLDRDGTRRELGVSKLDGIENNERRTGRR
ncbi:MAG TPA: hypothetical protein VM011_08890 [Gammaproteobacteria bacterium]|nr:hypothetical protein [Gammaproteobacteria bacterium]